VVGTKMATAVKPGYLTT